MAPFLGWFDHHHPRDAKFHGLFVLSFISMEFYRLRRTWERGKIRGKNADDLWMLNDYYMYAMHYIHNDSTQKNCLINTINQFNDLIDVRYVFFFMHI